MIPVSSSVARREQPGRHRLQRGFRMPGFGRVLSTREEHKVKTILARNGCQVLGEDELDGGAR